MGFKTLTNWDARPSNQTVHRLKYGDRMEIECGYSWTGTVNEVV